jgi:NAD(P)-dependent dehydrogenase (short-subunit alcohol dehydrogenase family)
MGFALARRFARGGATVVCIEAVGEQPDGGYDTGIVSAAILEQVVQEVKAAGNGGALALGVDPVDPTAWERAVGEVIGQLGRIDIACAFMGTTGPEAGDGPLLDVTLDSWQRCYNVNVVSPWLFGRACAADMVRRDEGGVLCFLSSYSAIVPPASNGAIASARAALNRVVEVMALELGGHGIRVNAVQPLSVVSEDERFPNPGLRRLAASGATNLDSWVGHNLALGRPQSPEETAAVAEFLCSDEASFVSGVSVPVAGGAHSHS